MAIKRKKIISLQRENKFLIRWGFWERSGMCSGHEGYGRRQRWAGGPWPPWIFIHGTGV